MTGWRDDRKEVRDIGGIYLGIADWVNIWACSEVGVVYWLMLLSSRVGN